MHAIHKKKSKSDPDNYRGVHLTTQLSKVVERIMGSVLFPLTSQPALFGANQYVYTPSRSHRDALAANVFHWLVLLDNGFQVALYCSDVSAAFDRVSSKILISKLAAAALPASAVLFLSSWIEDRRVQVLVRQTP